MEKLIVFFIGLFLISNIYAVGLLDCDIPNNNPECNPTQTITNTITTGNTTNFTNYVSTNTNQSSIVGDKNGSYNIFTSGKGKFGTSIILDGYSGLIPQLANERISVGGVAIEGDNPRLAFNVYYNGSKDVRIFNGASFDIIELAGGDLKFRFDTTGSAGDSVTMKDFLKVNSVTGDVSINNNLTASNIKVNNIDANNICYSNFTGCSGLYDYTNIAMINKTNHFDKYQVINGTIIDSFYVDCTSGNIDATPDCSGTYYFDGTNDGHPYYRRNDGSFYLWKDDDYFLYILSTSVGFIDDAWYENSGYLGGYYNNVVGTYTGDFYVYVSPFMIRNGNTPLVDLGAGGMVNAWFGGSPPSDYMFYMKEDRASYGLFLLEGQDGGIMRVDTFDGNTNLDNNNAGGGNFYIGRDMVSGDVHLGGSGGGYGLTVPTGSNSNKNITSLNDFLFKQNVNISKLLNGNIAKFRNVNTTTMNVSNLLTANFIRTNNLNVSGNVNVTQNIYIGGNISVKVPYAVFTDNTTQGLISTLAGQPMNFSITEDNYYINITNKQNITVKQVGDYHFIVSAIGICGNNNKHINVWWQKNGINVPRSNTLQELSTANVEALLTIPFIIDLNATDNLRIMWNADSTGCTLEYTPSTSFIPETPSIILTINRIGDIT